MNKLLSSLSMLSLCLYAGSSFAGTTGKVNFHGYVYGQTCQVKNTSENQHVFLPSVRSSSLLTAGATSTESANFNIEFVNCTAGVTAGVKFDQVNVNGTTGTLKNTFTGPYAADNVDIQIMANGQTINLAQQDKSHYKEALVDDAVVSYPFVARYYATGKATQGIVDTYATFKVDYK
ncbi:fimbrial protein [Acinetobacter rudis]|uniref:Fimbrial protein n=1 Tax=Acinetobacter rudis TaxID=632955 RepID=A0AAW8JBC7_9GAMM|nr:fimbrial protein [Acinetobacter rudis]MDQ8936390.1 fimbrial protein [Acinetobacter rudis]MDQ8952906.1 fimbrial protein [Acinetobacter rudis]MDQ9018659.1 fimbrial protein [Acinetobacter rudis]